MAGPKTSATFSIDLQDNVSDSAESAASSLESLRQTVNGGQERIKAYSSALRGLQGSTDEVKAAKAQLKAQIASTRSAVSQATLAMQRQGATIDGLNKRHAELARKAEETAKAEEDAKKKLGEKKSLLDQLRGKYEDAGGAAGVLAAGSLALAAAVVALGAAVVSGVVAFGRWVIAGADAARTMALMRESALGSASDAAALGTQIDALAGRVPLSREKIGELGLAMHRAGIGGQTLVDSMRAIAGATAGMDDAAGNQLKGILERGKLSQRLQINPLELQGSGLRLDDVAKKLAGNLGVGIAQAKRALVEGRVKLADGAKALADAVDERFGETNKKKTLGLDVQAKRLGENLGKLTDGVKIEPLLEGVSRLVNLFSDSTVAGAALKEIVTLAGNTLTGALTKGIPLAEAGFKKVVIAGLDIAIMALQGKKRFEEWFSQSNLSRVDWLSLAIKGIGIAADGALFSAKLLAGMIIGVYGFAAEKVDTLLGAFFAVKAGMASLSSFAKTLDFEALGRDIVSGLIRGLKGALPGVGETIGLLSDAIKNRFKGDMKIQSPSKVFAEYGENTGEGYAGGVRRSSGGAQEAISDMVEVPSVVGTAKSGGGAGRSSGGVVVHAPITIQATDGPSVQAVLPDVVAQLTEAIERGLITAGVTP